MEADNGRIAEQSVQNEEVPKPNNEQDLSSTVNTPVNGNDAEAVNNPVSSKDSQKPSPKKPKKRKPKMPRDVTAPRQPLTGLCFVLSLYLISNL